MITGNRSDLRLLLFLSLSMATMLVRADGEIVYEDWCEICHALEANMPGTDRIREVFGEERVNLRDSPFVSEETLRAIVRSGRGMMPPFRRTEISNAQLDELVDYLVAENEGNRE